MCLIVESGPHIADRDIPVFKGLRDDSCSPLQFFRYEPNKLYPEVDIVSQASGGAIRVGYHAWSYDHCYVVDGAMYHEIHRVRTKQDTGWGWSKTKQKFCAFVIPKGAIYYIGDDGDIVSNIIRSRSLKPLRIRDINRRNR